MKTDFITKLNALNKSTWNDTLDLINQKGFKTVNFWQLIVDLKSIESFKENISGLFDEKLEEDGLRLVQRICEKEKQIKELVKIQSYVKAENLHNETHQLKIELFKLLRNQDTSSFYLIKENIIDVFEFVF